MKIVQNAKINGDIFVSGGPYYNWAIKSWGPHSSNTVQLQKLLKNSKCQSVHQSIIKTPKPLRIAPMDHQAYQP